MGRFKEQYHKVNEATFTGFTDAKGKKLYDGDKVKATNKLTAKRHGDGKIVYKAPTFRVEWEKEQTHSPFFLKDWHKDIIKEQYNNTDGWPEFSLNAQKKSNKGNVSVLWADEYYVGDLKKSKKNAKYKGKRMDTEHIRNANKGYGTLFYIDSKNKAEAMSLMDKVKPHDKFKNVYYYGPTAEKFLKQF